MLDIAIIGDALIDEVRLADRTREAVGGSALNVAVGVRVLGRSTVLISMVGDDLDGARIADHVANANVNFHRTSAPLGTARAISIRENGEPQYIFNEAARERRIVIDDQAASIIDASRLVAVSGIALDNAAQADDILAIVRDPESRLILDPNPREGILKDRSTFVDNLVRLAERALLVKVSDEDAVLLGFKSLEELGAVLLQSGVRFVLGTAGPKGATLSSRGRSLHVPIATEDGPIVDTMGAGDATLATTLTGLLPG